MATLSTDRTAVSSQRATEPWPDPHFTDLIIPTSNHICQQIGYRPIADFQKCGVVKE